MTLLLNPYPKVSPSNEDLQKRDLFFILFFYLFFSSKSGWQSEHAFFVPALREGLHSPTRTPGPSCRSLISPSGGTKPK